jgi:hypothetical protein
VCTCSDTDLSANCSNRRFLSMPPALPASLRSLDLSYNDLETVNSTELLRLTQLEALDLRSGLPDGTISNQKYQFGLILKGPAMEDVGIKWPFGLFYGHLVYFKVICYIPPPFWYVVARKIWQPCLRSV